MSKVLSLKFCAEAAGIDPRTFARIRSAGHGPHIVQVSERRIGVLEADFAAWIESRRRPHAQGSLPIPAPTAASPKSEG